LKVEVFTEDLDLIELVADEVDVSNPACARIKVDGAVYKYENPVLVRVAVE